MEQRGDNNMDSQCPAGPDESDNTPAAASQHASEIVPPSVEESPKDGTPQLPANYKAAFPPRLAAPPLSEFSPSGLSGPDRDPHASLLGDLDRESGIHHCVTPLPPEQQHPAVRRFGTTFSGAVVIGVSMVVMILALVPYTYMSLSGGLSEDYLKQGIKATREGNVKAADDYFSKAFNVAAKQGDDSPEARKTMLWHAEAQLALGRREEAQRIFQKLLSQANAEPTQLVAAATDLGIIHMQRGEYSAAHTVFDQASDLTSRLPKNSPRIPLLQQARANLAIHEQANRQAIDLLKTALAGARASSMSEGEQSAILNDLGKAYEANGEAEEAEKSYREALEMRARGLTANSPALAESEACLGSLYLQQKKTAEAEPLLRKAFEIYSKSQIESLKPKAADIECSIALIKEDHGKWNDAEELLKNALARRKESLGEDDPLVLHTARMYDEAHERAQRAP